MKNGRWYLVYTKTDMEWDELSGCCGGVGSGGAFVDVKTHKSILLESNTETKARKEAEEKWRKICADIETAWIEGKERYGENFAHNYSHQGFLDSQASNPSVVYKLRKRSAKERIALQKEDEE